MLGHTQLQVDLAAAQVAGNESEQIKVLEHLAVIEGRYTFSRPGNLRESNQDIKPIKFETWLRHQWQGIPLEYDWEECWTLTQRWEWKCSLMFSFPWDGTNPSMGNLIALFIGFLFICKAKLLRLHDSPVQLGYRHFFIVAFDLPGLKFHINNHNTLSMALLVIISISDNIWNYNIFTSQHF
jgi:hypothetical protein